jgi:DNA processing protein
VPGNIYNSGSQGPLYLIQNGAVPVSCGQDILRELQWWLPSGKSQPDLNAEQATVEGFTALSDVERQVLGGISYDPVSVENLSQTTGLPFAKINEILTLLELEGLIVLMPGAKVCRR